MSSSPTDIALLCRAQRMGSDRNHPLGTAGIFQPGESSILPRNDTRRTTRMIQHISAVTFAVRDMARAAEVYQKLGFELLYGGERAAVSSLKAGGGFVNLSSSPRYDHTLSGRPIFPLDDLAAQH